MKILAKITLLGCISCLSTSVTLLALPNPASENCINKGGKLEIRTTERGDQYGVCVWDNGPPARSECEEWALFRGECRKSECAQWSAEYDSEGNFKSYCSKVLHVVPKA